MKLILASKSPQRKRILNKMGIRFKVIPSHIDESAGKLKKPHAIAKKIARDKALSVAKKYPDQWTLGCDTFVILSDGSLSLKPKNRAEAEKTLELYRNSYCDVYSGIALIHLKLNKKIVQYEKTRLHFKDFSDEALKKYLDSNEWKDRSGSMTIEGKAGKWITKVIGDYWNVVGLPAQKLKNMLIEAKLFSANEISDI